MIRRAAFALLSITFVAAAQEKSQENPAARITENHAVTEADGTVRMQRVIPLPQSLSPEAKAWLSRPLASDANVPRPSSSAAPRSTSPRAATATNS